MWERQPPLKCPRRLTASISESESSFCSAKEPKDLVRLDFARVGEFAHEVAGCAVKLT